MSPKTKDGKSKKIKRMPESEIFATAHEREQHAKQAAAAAAEKSAADQVLIAQLQLRSVRSLESDKFGDGMTRITLVQPEPVEYDSDGIFKACKAKQRDAAFDRQINLNALSEDARKKVIDVLSKEELAEVTSWSLNLDKLAKAVQAKIIDKEIVSDNSWIKEISPSIRISHGSGS